MFIKIKNLNLHYKAIGAGPPLLLLHGWGCQAEHLGRLQDYFAQRFTVYAIDLPGFGLSTAPDKIWGSNEYAEFIAEFIRVTRISSPVLMGHSFGGKIIINLIARNLVEAKKAVLISSAGVKLPRSLRTMVKICFFKLLKNIARVPLIKNILGARLELYRNKFGSEDYRNSSGIMRAILVKLVNEDLSTLLPLIKIPVLLIWGDKDFNTPLAAGEVMQRLITTAKLKVFPGSGHFPFLDNYEQVRVELENFLYGN